MSVEDDVFIGPNAAFTNDKYPRRRHWLAEFSLTLVRPASRSGKEATVGAGAVVTENVPPNATMYRNSARIHGYRAVPREKAARIDAASVDDLVRLPGDARAMKVTRAVDMRGSLVAPEFGELLRVTPS